MLEISVFQNPGHAARQHKANCAPAAAAGGKALTPEDGGGMTLAMEMVQNGVDARFRDLVSRSEYLLGLRCALCQYRQPRKAKLVYRSGEKNLTVSV